MITASRHPAHQQPAPPPQRGAQQPAPPTPTPRRQQRLPRPERPHNGSGTANGAVSEEDRSRLYSSPAACPDVGRSAASSGTRRPRLVAVALSNYPTKDDLKNELAVALSNYPTKDYARFDRLIDLREATGTPARRLIGRKSRRWLSDASTDAVGCDRPAHALLYRSVAAASRLGADHQRGGRTYPIQELEQAPGTTSRTPQRLVGLVTQPSVEAGTLGHG